MQIRLCIGKPHAKNYFSPDLVGFRKENPPNTVI